MADSGEHLLTNVYVSPEATYLCVDVPGYCGDLVTVETSGDSLVVRAARRGDRLEGQPLVAQIPHGPLRRTFKLDSSVDTENLSASLKNGVLTVRLPRRDTSLPKKISIAAE